MDAFLAKIMTIQVKFEHYLIATIKSPPQSTFSVLFMNRAFALDIIGRHVGVQVVPMAHPEMLE